MVREALAHATPVAVDGAEVVLAVADGAVHLEGLERNRQVVVEALSETLGAAVRVTFRAVTEGPVRASLPEPQRLNDRTDREGRLRSYRAKDATLDSAAEALDLELIE